MNRCKMWFMSEQIIDYDADTKNKVWQNFCLVRHQTEKICSALNLADHFLHAKKTVSSPQWHLAHTSYFFETFLVQNAKQYRVYNKTFFNLFHSCCQAAISHLQEKLVLTNIEDVYNYRRYVNQAVHQLIDSSTEIQFNNLLSELNKFLTHEQLHQELLLRDIKYNYYFDLSFPAYHCQMNNVKYFPVKDEFIPFDDHLIKQYSIRNQLVTNREYLSFIHAGGYERPEFWSKEGWECVQKNAWTAPLYWQTVGRHWTLFTLNGLQELKELEPVSHVSYYEADAYARFCNMRLPTEWEWEYSALKHALDQGNFLENLTFHPMPASYNNCEKLYQLYGDVWEWTTSSYFPELMVLRGGSCITPSSFIHLSNRHFLPHDMRLHFSGIRLVKEI